MKRAIAAALVGLAIAGAAADPDEARLEVDPAIFRLDCLAPDEASACSGSGAPVTGAPSASAALLEPRRGAGRLLVADLDGLLDWGPVLACTACLAAEAGR